MLGRVVENSLFTPSLQDSKLIALILNYNLPSHTHKLLQKGVTAVLAVGLLVMRAQQLKLVCCSADMYLCRWWSKQVVQCCPKLRTSHVPSGSS